MNPFDPQDFKAIYDYATLEPYSFLTVNYQKKGIKKRFFKQFQQIELG